MEMLKKEILEHFKQTQTIYFATCDGKQPFVRPVTLIHINNEFFVATSYADSKVNQIKNNPNIEFCLMIPKNENESGYIRAKGKADLSMKIEAKKMVFKNVDFIKQFWNSPEHPDFTLVEIEISEFEYIRPGEMTAEKITLK
jgi:uncharacterized pyridoxamine 5'-phosphate oxidase family protein